jgi:hypothetical protein
MKEGRRKREEGRTGARPLLRNALWVSRKEGRKKEIEGDGRGEEG